MFAVTYGNVETLETKIKLQGRLIKEICNMDNAKAKLQVRLLPCPLKLINSHSKRSVKAQLNQMQPTQKIYTEKPTGIRPSVKSINYRILTAERKIKFAGTGEDSWFDLATAKKKVDYSAGEMIYEYEHGEPLWEVL